MPGAQASGGTITCENECVTLQGVGNGSYSWTGPGGFSSTDQNPTVCAPGVYTLTVTGDNGCTSTATAEVLQDTNVPGAQASGGTITCENQCVVLQGVGNGTYSWTGPNGFTSNDQNPQVCEPGIYTLTVTGANGCTSQASADVLLNMEMPDVTAEGCELNCEGDPCQMNGSSSTPGVTFTWSSANGFVSNDEDPLVSLAGFYTLTVTAPNGCSNEIEVAVTQAICDDKCKFEIICPKDTTVACGTSLDWTVVGEPYFPTKDKEECPDLEFISWNDEWISNCPYVLMRTWTAGDEAGNVASCVQYITVIDEVPPVFHNLPADATVECSEWVPENKPDVWAIDECKLDFAVQVEFTEEVIPGECANEFTVVRTWTAADECGNTAFAQQLVNVVDTQAPVFDCDPQDMKVCCKDIPEAETCTATDNCSENIAYDYHEDKSKGDCDTDYEIVRTWTATDDCGNTATVSQTIVVTLAACKKPEEKVNVMVQPNPFRDRTMISFTAPVDGMVVLEVFDAGGRQVTELYRGTMKAGQSQQALFEPQHNSGEYGYRLIMPDRVITGRIMGAF